MNVGRSFTKGESSNGITLCLMMGSAAGVNNTFDKILYCCELNFGEYDYFYADSIYDEHGRAFKKDKLSMEQRETGTKSNRVKI